MVHQILHLEVAAGRVLSDDGITVQGQFVIGRRYDAAAFFFRFVEHAAANAPDIQLGFPFDRIAGIEGNVLHFREEPRQRGFLHAVLRFLRRRGEVADSGQNVGAVLEAGEAADGARLVQGMHDDPGQQLKRGPAPVIHQSLAIAVDDHERDVLRVADLVMRAVPDLAERVPGAACSFFGRIEPQYDIASLYLPPSCGHGIVFTLDIQHENAVRPAKQGRNDKADALAGSGRRYYAYMFRPVMAKVQGSPVFCIKSAAVDARSLDEPRLFHIFHGGKACRAMRAFMLL